MFLELLGNIFAPLETNFVSVTMFPEVGKQGNIDRKHNVSATLCPGLVFYHEVYTKFSKRMRICDDQTTILESFYECEMDRKRIWK